MIQGCCARRDFYSSDNFLTFVNLSDIINDGKNRRDRRDGRMSTIALIAVIIIAIASFAYSIYAIVGYKTGQ